MTSEINLEEQLGSRGGRVARVVGLILILVALFSLVLFNAGRRPSTAEKVWDMATTIGRADAKNHYIMYTDLMCPYCDVFARHLKENREEFVREFIEGRDILWEVRLTDFLREYGHDAPIYSEWSAEGVYCAKRAGKFWDYYYAALDALDRDYHSKGVGISKTAPKIADMQPDYWLKIGETVGLGEDFRKCYNEHEALAEVREKTERAGKIISSGGLPSFQFNQKLFSGIDPADDWGKIKLRLESGLK